MTDLVIDNFAGGGGASTGIEAALGRPVDIAVNHDRAAVEMHRANHPGTRHLCEDVWAVDPVKECTGPDGVLRRVGLAWFSPDCKHFSKAKGGKPVEKKIRGLAWVVIKWAELVRPRVIILENVQEFTTWGPLSADGRPCPRRKGRTFRSWTGKLRKLGYDVQWRDLSACDYGAPTIRKRLFLIARCDGERIVWPEKTHGKSTGVGAGTNAARPAADRSADHGGDGCGGRDGRPEAAVCQHRGHVAGPDAGSVPHRDLAPWRTAAECIDWSVPCPSIFERVRPLAEATLRRIANGVRRYVIECAEPFIVNLTHGARVEELGEPLRTITGAHRGEKALVTPFIAGAGGPVYGGKPRPVDAPLNTVLQENHAALVTPLVMKQNYGVKPCQGVDEPLHVVTTQCNKFNLVSPTLVQTGYGEREGQSPRAPGLHKPLGTVVGGGCKHALVEAFIVKHFGGMTGVSIGTPLPTTTARGTQNQLAAVHLSKLYGTCKDGVDAREPMPTVTGGGQHIAEVRAFLVKYYGNEKGGVSLREPMPTVTGRDRLGVVLVRGVEYQIVDIGMRMLTPRELARAQGFPESYILTGTKTSQVARIGNSVCPCMAEVLVRANCCAEVAA